MDWATRSRPRVMSPPAFKMGSTNSRKRGWMTAGSSYDSFSSPRSRILCWAPGAMPSPTLATRSSSRSRILALAPSSVRAFISPVQTALPFTTRAGRSAGIAPAGTRAAPSLRAEMFARGMSAAWPTTRAASAPAKRASAPVAQPGSTIRGELPTCRILRTAASCPSAATSRITSRSSSSTNARNAFLPLDAATRAATGLALKIEAAPVRSVFQPGWRASRNFAGLAASRRTSWVARSALSRKSRAPLAPTPAFV